jgi:Schlafen, AlbA_2
VGNRARVLAPVLKSSKELDTVEFEVSDLKNLLFYCHKEKAELSGTNTLKYIEWGETEGFQERPSCKGRKRWWDVGERRFSDAIFPCSFGDCFKWHLNSKIFIDKRLYEIYWKDGEFINGLNSTLSPFFLEIQSRTGLGDGLMDLTVYEAENLPILKTRVDLTIERVISDIFTELGFNRHLPIREQEPQPLPDRKALDDLIFNKLGLTRAERKEVYWATAELVKQRLDKAGSYKGSKKTRMARHAFAPPPEDEKVVKIRALLAQGEDKQTEFKSSLRPGDKSNSRFTGVKHNILKSIAAFLNTDGGTLLIGITPDSSVGGLEAHDYTTFAEADKADAWRKHFDNVVQTFFGNHLHPLIALDLVSIDGRTVASISVKSRAPREVWLKNRDDRDREEFYIRRTASTTKLEGPEATEYIRQVWQ